MTLITIFIHIENMSLTLLLIKIVIFLFFVFFIIPMSKLVQKKDIKIILQKIKKVFRKKYECAF